MSASGITDANLDKYSNIVRANDIILLYTATSDKWRTDETIRNNFTYLELSAADWIVDHEIKCVGIDTLSVEKYGSKEGLSHKMFVI